MLVNEVVVFLCTSGGKVRAFVVNTQYYVALILIIYEINKFLFVHHVLNFCDKT